MSKYFIISCIQHVCWYLAPPCSKSWIVQKNFFFPTDPSLHPVLMSLAGVERVAECWLCWGAVLWLQLTSDQTRDNIQWVEMIPHLIILIIISARAELSHCPPGCSCQDIGEIRVSCLNASLQVKYLQKYFFWNNFTDHPQYNEPRAGVSHSPS